MIFKIIYFKALVTLSLLLLTFVPCFSQVSDDRIAMAAVMITGAGSVENLDESEIERFQYLVEHPVSINRASRSKLLSSGLFSSFQVASIVDYRARSGEILSFAELATIYGFSPEIAAALRPFIILESSGPPASVRSYGKQNLDVDNTLITKMSMRVKESDGKTTSVAFSEGAKYNVEVDGIWIIGAGVKTGTEHTSKGLKWDELGYSATAAYISPWTGKRFQINKIVVGDFNMHFGQGLVMWSGFSLSGLSNVTAFSRNPGGAVPYRSYNGSNAHRGVAVELGWGHLSLTSALSFTSESLLPLVNLTYYGRTHQESITAYCSVGYDGKPVDVKASGDFRVNLRGVDMFGEVAYDCLSVSGFWKSLAFLTGARSKIGDKLTVASLVRRYPSGYSAGWAGAARAGTKCSDEHGAALAARLKAGDYVGYQPQHLLDVSLDCAAHMLNKHLQIKAIADYNYMISSSWEMEIRALYRHRNYDQIERFELRSDIKWHTGKLTVKTRLHGVYGDALAGLVYLEGGYSSPGKLNVSMWLRGGVYHTDGWNDRIYVYERDAPGNFNVPAMSGDGWWLSSYVYMKVKRFMKLGIRVATYGLSKQELKFQLSFSF